MRNYNLLPKDCVLGLAYLKDLKNEERGIYKNM